MRWTWLLCAAPLAFVPFACASSFSTQGSGGGGGGSSSSSTGGSTGSVTGFVCDTPTDCPPAASQCETVGCVQHQCVKNPLPADTAVPNKIVGNCTAEICDGSGKQTTKPDTGDVFDDGNPCTKDTCLGTTPKNTPTKGAKCTSDSDKRARVCDDTGTCVQCNTGGSDCPGGGLCLANFCVLATCGDTLMDGDETDVDCGGDGCVPCDDGKKCSVDTDCANHVCSGSPKKCQAPTCSDQHQNADETDVDCGGPTCDPCPNGAGCAMPDDCVSQVCKGGSCAIPKCNDGVANGGESDKDCGGATTCARCPDGDKCTDDSDCLTQHCDANGKCNHCNDGKIDFGESDTDCGASCVQEGGSACQNGQMCTQDDDCVSNKCCNMQGMSVVKTCQTHCG